MNAVLPGVPEHRELRPSGAHGLRHRKIGARGAFPVGGEELRAGRCGGGEPISGGGIKNIFSAAQLKAVAVSRGDGRARLNDAQHEQQRGDAEHGGCCGEHAGQVPVLALRRGGIPIRMHQNLRKIKRH